MTLSKARAVFWLHALLALLGASVTALALLAAAANVRRELPSAAALLSACQSVVRGADARPKV